MLKCQYCNFEGADWVTCPQCKTTRNTDKHAPTAHATTANPPLYEWDSLPGYPRNHLEAWRNSMFMPTVFFRGLQYEGNTARPILYLISISIVSAFISLGITSLRGVTNDELTSNMWMLKSFSYPLFLNMGRAVILTLLLHLFVRIFAGHCKGIAATTHAVCFAAGPQIFYDLPVIGPYIVLPWDIILLVIAFREAHSLSNAASVIAVLIAKFGVPLALFATGWLYLQYVVVSMNGPL